MKTFFSLNIICTALLLTACSGGINGSKNFATNNPNKPTIPTINTTIQGNTIALSGTGSAIGNNTATAGTNAINKIIINGQTIEFLPNTANHKTGTQFDHVRYGYVRQDVNSMPHLFAQGVTATNIPTQGTASYYGTAVHIRTTGSSPEITTPRANFNVDFANKTITGKIHAVQVVDLAGNISSNKFSGTTSQGYAMNGYFYGNLASELGGTYSNSSGSVSGAFGAKK